jgi:hypothetical protein
VNDPFVGKLYHFAINHASGLHLHKKANYLAHQIKFVIVTLGFDALPVNIRKLTKLFRPYLLTKKISNIPYQ